MAVALTGTAFAQSRKTVQPSDLVDLRTVNDVQISPDGDPWWREVLQVDARRKNIAFLRRDPEPEEEKDRKKKKRLVIGGWSYGGYTTAWGITHSQRFKAAMVGAGISDLFSMGLTTDISPSYLDDYFGPVVPHCKLYEAHSAISYLDQVTTPTLILHGESDLRVPVSQSYELFNGFARYAGRSSRGRQGIAGIGPSHLDSIDHFC